MIGTAVCQPADPADCVTWRNRNFRVVRHPAVAAALTEFRSPFEAGTLEFFDAALPACDKMIDIGAYVGLMSLYAADRLEEVCAFEASPGNFDLLRQNVAVNGRLRRRIRLFGFGLGDRDDHVPLYRKAVADSGSTIFRTVERGGLVDGAPEAMVELRDADTVLCGIGVTGRTLLKIDIEGAEYSVVPTIAALLAEAKPFLHLSFHPFNIVADGDDYLTAVTRLRRALQVAEALAVYRYMYFYEDGQWRCVGGSDRMMFFRQYLLRPKPLPRIASQQYGFIDAIGFADAALPALGSTSGD
nr:FkbM family methyltransferase [uncultured Rhodopila sp.]